MTGGVKTALGIDIGPNRVSMAVVERKGDEYRVVRAVSRSPSQDAPASDQVEDVAALVATLRKLRRQGRIPRMSAMLGVSVSPLVLQMLDMPKQMPQNVREFVENELGQYVTLSGKTIVCDFCAVGSSRDSQRRLLSVAGEKETIQRLVEACSVAGLSVEAVEPSILAYVRVRCRQRRIGARPGTVLVVEMTDHQLSACLLRRGTLDFVRTKGLPAEVEGCETANEWLVDEVVTMMRHCNLESSGADAGWEVDILIREGVRVTGQIAEALKVRTGVLPQIIMESGSLDSVPALGDPVSMSGAWMTAAGLAMRRLDARSDAGDVDLLPGDVTHLRSLVKHMLITATVAALVFLGMISSLLLVTRAADAKRDRLDRQRFTEQLYLTPAVAAQTRVVDRQLARVERQLREIQKAMEKANGVNWSQVLTAVAESLPAGVQFTRLSSQDGQRLTIGGLATSGSAVQRLEQALGRNELFESVSLGRVDTVPGSKSWVRYQMDCVMKPQEQETGRES